jgi:hypothetical protein
MSPVHDALNAFPLTNGVGAINGLMPTMIP